MHYTCRIYNKNKNVVVVIVVKFPHLLVTQYIICMDGTRIVNWFHFVSLNVFIFYHHLYSFDILAS